MDKLSVQDLAMFIGCEAEYMYVDEETHTGKGTLISVNLNLDRKINFPIVIIDKDDNSRYRETKVNPDEVKPILRPLSDMTDEEINEYKVLKPEYTSITDKKTLIKVDARSIKYLVSKHFDIFGWIEKGLAIDKTKL